VIAKILDTVAAFDELPVGQLFCLGDLFRGQAGDGVEPRPLLFRPRRLVNLGGFFRRAPRFGRRGLGFGLVVRLLHFREWGAGPAIGAVWSPPQGNPIASQLILNFLLPEQKLC
jgi:hypothetical protein